MGDRELRLSYQANQNSTQGWRQTKYNEATIRDRSKRCGWEGEKEAIVNDILGGDKEKRRGHMANSETAAEVKQVIGR